MKFLIALAVTSLLASCGGGGGGSEAADTTAPTITGVAVSAPSNGQLNLTASASDTKGVTGYCFKTSSTVPTASDACFTSDAVKSINTPDTDITYFTWAKDAAGNISNGFTTSLNGTVAPVIPDTAAPVMTGVTVSAPNNGQVTLTASAIDTKGVTGYCFKTSSTLPTASDACFSPSSAFTIATPATPSRYYVWSKDAANNLSQVFERVTGNCSATGVTASQNSALPTVCVSTSLGEFVLALESVKAPTTTTNFLKYVNDGFYNQTVFHRVLSNFMVQGGGFTGVPISSANAKSGIVYSPIALETTATTGLSNTTGTVAMARTNVLNSATNQFFINVVDNIFLNASSGGYATFGSVISGLDTTVQSIRGLPVQSNGTETSQPLNPPVINWAYQLK